MSFIAVAIGGGALIGGIASVAGSSIQAGAANNAANLQSSDAAKSLAEQQREFDTQQQNEAPFLATGQDAAKQLQAGLQPGGSLVQPWTNSFTPPTSATEQNDPGYQFRLQQGQQALENSASAKGGLLSGNTAVAEQQYGQDYASNEYSNVYNRQFGEFANRYNINQNNQADEWNRFATLAGLGQTSASTLNANAGQIAGNVNSLYTNLGSQLGQDANNAGAARASGYVGAGNAWSSGLSGGTNSLMDMILMSQMGKH